MARTKADTVENVNKRKSHRTKSKGPEQLSIEEFSVHSAILNDDLSMLESLINKGADLNERDKNGDTPLILAIKENKHHIVARLLEEGADTNKLGANTHTPLALASLLEHRECIDMLMQYGTTSTKTNRDDYILSDRVSEFISELSSLLKAEINLNQQRNSDAITNQVIVSTEKFLNIKEVLPGAFNQMKLDISAKIAQALANVQNNPKAILKLCRRIIVVMQNHKNSFATELTWILNKIESMLEERIVAEAEDNASFTSYQQEKKPREESWYLQNGYANLTDFIHANQSTIEALKYLDIKKEKIPVKLTSGSTQLEIVTISPYKITQSKELSLLLPDALKRLRKECEFGLHDNFDALKATIKQSKKNAVIMPEIDNALRPGISINIIHFHNDHEYERFWIDFAKESFTTGAKLLLFNTPLPQINGNAVCCGLSIINRLLENEVHPDKIFLQGYGAGTLVAKEVSRLFLKQGIELAQISYQHPKFQANEVSQIVCHPRNLNIYSSELYSKKMLENIDCPKEYLPFAKYISKLLHKAYCTTNEIFMTERATKAYSLVQLINFFFKTNQHFLQNHTSYKNPDLPLERVQML